MNVIKTFKLGGLVAPFQDTRHRACIKLKCPIWVTKRRLGVDQTQQKVSCQGRPLGLQGIAQAQIRSWTSICLQAAKLFMFKRLL